MKTFMKDVLEQKGSNYILPFFWQHGETEEVLRDYMRAINESGIGAVCVEARPHPDYAGDKWWEDMDVILDEARTRGMKVWILDDAHFPTGYANGKMPQMDESLCKHYIAMNRTDVIGPVPQATLHVAEFAKYVFNPLAGGNPIFREREPRKFETPDEMIAVIAARLVESDTVSAETIDLTDKVVDGWLEWDVPDGAWRIFIVYKTFNGGGNTGYINMLDEASCRVQIDAVYEPHYARYKDDFGKTIAGFFSDEPAVGNTIGFDFDDSIGRKLMHLPWNKDMNGMLIERLGEDYAKYLPALWADFDNAELTGHVRYSYMDAVTALVGESFSNQIGKWCAEHGVEYIGHIVEDLNQHSRLGGSQGHFFRSMKGQHMAGIDCIGNQTILGGEDHHRLPGFAQGGEGEFYHFELGKLGSSHAHIDPKKKGRAMCEIYGACGWQTGTRQMKPMTDHFLVRGINTYVPHAFSPKAFPDPDCPPHFYAHGENPQYRHFGKLMGYVNRMCHVLNNGMHVAPVAVLYHGEAEWSGGYMFDQKPGRQLLEHQIDFDILPSDVFAFHDEFNTSYDNGLTVNGETYKALVVPYSQFITKAVAEFAAKASKEGFGVYFVDKKPEGVCDVQCPKTSAALIAALDACKEVPLGELAATLKADGVPEIVVDGNERRLRYYHYIHEGAHLYMFSNEETGRAIECDVTVPVTGPVYAYDAMENRIHAIEATPVEGGTKLHINLGVYESTVVIFDEAEVSAPVVPQGEAVVVTGTWDVSICENKQYPNFEPLAKMDALTNVAKLAPEFAGFIRYENTLNWDGEGDAILTIDNAYEGVEVFVNGENAGMRICPPYQFELNGLLKNGENTLKIEVATTMFRKTFGMNKEPAPFGPKPIFMEPLGIIGDVKVYKK